MSFRYFCRQIGERPSKLCMPHKPACIFTFREWNTWHAFYVDRLNIDRQQPSDLSGYEIPDKKARKKSATLQALVKQRYLSSTCTQMCHNIWTDGWSVMEKAFSGTSGTFTVIEWQNCQQKTRMGSVKILCSCWRKGMKGSIGLLELFLFDLGALKYIIDPIMQIQWGAEYVGEGKGEVEKYIAWWFSMWNKVPWSWSNIAIMFLQSVFLLSLFLPTFSYSIDCVWFSLFKPRVSKH